MLDIEYEKNRVSLLKKQKERITNNLVEKYQVESIYEFLNLYKSDTIIDGTEDTDNCEQ